MNQDGFDAEQIGQVPALYILKLLFEKALRMVDAAATGHLHNVDDKTLNHYFTTTKFLIDELLKSGNFEELNDGIAYLPKSLIGNKDIDEEWETARRDAYDFLARIESSWLKEGGMTFELTGELQKVFKDIDRAVEDHKEYAAELDNLLLKRFKRAGSEELITIKSIRLDEDRHLLEINGGERTIQFKSKRGDRESEKETKRFKILRVLWDFRWEMKSGSVVMEGDYTILENLQRISGSVSIGAVHKEITRLNNRFKEEKVPIHIDHKNGTYRLVVHLF